MAYKDPQSFYDAVIGKSVDTDNYPPKQKFQCWDLKSKFVIDEGLNVNMYCNLTGYAGDLYKLRYEKGFDKYFDFFYPKHAKRGDWIYWDRHVAMVWDVDLANDRVLCLGQNQSGHPYVDLKWYKLSTALGCMRYYPWIKGETSMNGIDISNWQKGIDLAKVKSEFVIVKATEGINFKDPYFKGFIDKAIQLKRKVGFYHFARPENNSAITEANYFCKYVEDYIGKGIPILDWESKGKADVAWAKKWLDEVYAVTGVKPMIYMSESVVNAYDWSAVAKAGYPLWVAKYRDNTADYNYDMTNAGSKPSVKHWSSYVMWQWTSSGRLDGYSGNLDCNVFYGSGADWDKLAEVNLFMNGWVKKDDKWFYYKNKKPVTGWQKLKWSKGEDWFYFTETGAMVTGWQKLSWSKGSSWFYFEPKTGAMQTGFKKIPWRGRLSWYYLDPSTGAMQTGPCTLEIVLGKDGRLAGGKAK